MTVALVTGEAAAIWLAHNQFLIVFPPISNYQFTIDRLWILDVEFDAPRAVQRLNFRRTGTHRLLLYLELM